MKKIIISLTLVGLVFMMGRNLTQQTPDYEPGLITRAIKSQEISHRFPNSENQIPELCFFERFNAQNLASEIDRASKTSERLPEDIRGDEKKVLSYFVFFGGIKVLGTGDYIGAEPTETSERPYYLYSLKRYLQLRTDELLSTSSAQHKEPLSN